MAVRSIYSATTTKIFDYKLVSRDLAKIFNLVQNDIYVVVHEFLPLDKLV